ncbi:MAG: hypothetical protein VKN13_01095, partial [Cyanobacteriota bacterium]|nr:hypothetical protein [Cyanobacteriota bacterium]
MDAQHWQGTRSGGPGQDQLIGQITAQAELLEGIDHRVDVVNHHATGALEVVAPQHPGHLDQHHIRQVHATA